MSRSYIHAMPQEWADKLTDPAQRTNAERFTRDAAAAALGVDVRAIPFDPDKASYFVSEAFLKDNPSVDVKAALKNFLGKDAERMVQASRPSDAKAITPPKVALEDRIVLSVPAYEVKDGQVVTDEKGRPTPVSRGMTARLEKEFGAKSQHMLHVYNPDTNVMGNWVVSQNEVSRSKPLAAYIGQFLGPQAAVNVEIASKFETTAKSRTKEFVSITKRDIVSGQGRDELAAQLRQIDDPEKFRKYHAALSKVRTGVVTEINSQELAFTRYAESIASKTPVPGNGPNDGRVLGEDGKRAKKLNNAWEFTAAEQALLDARRVGLGLDSPKRNPDRSDRSPEAVASRNPMNKGLTGFLKDIDSFGKVMEGIYEQKTFPIPTLSGLIESGSAERHRPAAVSGAAAALG